MEQIRSLLRRIPRCPAILLPGMAFVWNIKYVQPAAQQAPDEISILAVVSVDGPRESRSPTPTDSTVAVYLGEATGPETNLPGAR